MTTKLYVTNLSRSATLASLRQFFGACGDVVDVEFLAERNSRPVSAAYVTMASEVAAARAVSKLHGSLLLDRSIMVTVASDDQTHRPRETAKANSSAPHVRIAQQYRDRHGMSYDLDCTGQRLTLRFLFPVEPEQAWRVQATADADLSNAVEATASTRELALDGVAKACDETHTGRWQAIRWVDVAAALKVVRAI